MLILAISYVIGSILTYHTRRNTYPKELNAKNDRYIAILWPLYLIVCILRKIMY